MKTPDLLLILVGVFLNAVAQLLLKAGTNSVGAIGGMQALRGVAVALMLHPAIIAGMACYVVSLVVWIVALSRVDVSIAYPMLSLGYVMNAALASWLFGEHVDLQRGLGIGIILIGVTLVARSGAHG